MAKLRRKVRGVPLLLLVGILWRVAGAEPVAADVQDIPRVRSDDPQIRDLVAEASRRSATFRELVATIGNTDGIVYVERGRCGFGVRACLAMSVIVAGPSRILRVLIDPQKSDDETIVSLGHEFRHVLEVLAEPSITSNAAMLLHYKRFGTWIGDAIFETRAAEAAGAAVRRELAQSRDRATDPPRRGDQ
jgi:hypothetical protein